jgi:hypothetical protein
MIYLIITSSIINKSKYSVVDDEHRKNTYLTSIKETLSHLPSYIKPILVENNGERDTYLDNLGIKVNYTNNNEKEYYCKALNELDDIKEMIQKYNMQDDDIVIKLTGRYKVFESHFFDFIVKNEDKYDAFMKYYNVCTFEFSDEDCVMGMFGIRCNYLKEFNYKPTHKEGDPSVEVQFARYVNNLNLGERLYKSEYIYLECCFADDLYILYT